jgi:uncharacterized protein YbjT (DUF2867 family)
MTPTVLVLGATGTIGRTLVPLLRARGAAVRAATRHPAQAGPEVAFDFDDPRTWAPALEGATSLFLMARPGDEAPDVVGLPLLEAARRAGVAHVVSLTGLGTDTRGDSPLRRVELALEASGLAFTHLRPNYFFQNFTVGPLLAGLQARGCIELPAGEGRTSFIDARDIAAVAAEALLDASHRGQGYALTGGTAVTHAEVAQALSVASGRPLRYHPQTDEEARVSLLAAGVPPARVERRLGFYAAVRQGALAAVSPDVARVLGRPPIGLGAFARDFVETWAASAS